MSIVIGGTIQSSQEEGQEEGDRKGGKLYKSFAFDKRSFNSFTFLAHYSYLYSIDLDLCGQEN